MNDGSTTIGRGNQITEMEMTRVKSFLMLQGFFLLVSPLAGGFHYKIWSMLDSAILILSIGITGLMLVLETRRTRTLAFKFAVIFYVLAVIDMSVNVLLSGWFGWFNSS